MAPFFCPTNWFLFARFRNIFDGALFLSVHKTINKRVCTNKRKKKKRNKKKNKKNKKTKWGQTKSETEKCIKNLSVIDYKQSGNSTPQKETQFQPNLPSSRIPNSAILKQIVEIQTNENNAENNSNNSNNNNNSNRNQETIENSINQNINIGNKMNCVNNWRLKIENITGFNEFAEYLVSEYAIELLLFVVECVQFKQRMLVECLANQNINDISYANIRLIVFKQ